MKPAARKDDHHECADAGPNMGAHLKVEQGSPNIFINNRPAARVGDEVSCRMTTGKNPVIAEGSTKVFFNGKPAARMGDRVEKGGSVSSGSGNVFIGDGGACIRIGNGTKVRIGDACNVYLSCRAPGGHFSATLSQALAAAKQAKAKAFKALSPDCIANLDSGTKKSDAFASHNSNPSEFSSGNSVSTDQSSVNIEQCKVDANIKPLTLTAVKQNDNEEKYIYYVINKAGKQEKLSVFGPWKLLEDFSTADFSGYFEVERWEDLPKYGGISGAGRPKAAIAGLVLSSTSELGTLGLRHELLEKLKQLHPQVKAKMPSSGGVLLQAIDQIDTNGDATKITLIELDIIGSGSDYMSLIKKWTSESGIKMTPSFAAQEIATFYIWAVKE